MNSIQKLLTARNLVVLALVLLSIAARLIPHMPNVTPVAAVALLAGAYWKKPWSLLVPAAIMLVSDIFVGFYAWQIMLSVYGSLILTAWMGEWVKKYNPWRVIGSAIASSVIFYLVTNAAVWAFGHMYPATFDGLILSYYYGLPFFRLTLLGNMAYTFAIFLAAEYVPVLLTRAQKSSATSKATATI